MQSKGRKLSRRGALSALGTLVMAPLVPTPAATIVASPFPWFGGKTRSPFVPWGDHRGSWGNYTPAPFQIQHGAVQESIRWLSKSGS